MAKAWSHAGLPTPLILFEGGLTLLHVCAILMKIRNLLDDTVISHVGLGYNFNDLIRRKGKRQSGRQMVRSAWVFDALLQTWDIAFSLSSCPGLAAAHDTFQNMRRTLCILKCSSKRAMPHASVVLLSSFLL